MGREDDLPGPGRLEAFSDGVIAIIITIMVLELKLPEHAGDLGLWQGVLKPLGPKLISYAMSFLVVAIMWVNHHALIATVGRATPALLWQNLHLLFWMSLIPFTTAYVGEHPDKAEALAAYGFVLAASGAAFALLRWQASAQGREDPHLARVHKIVLRKSILGASLYALSVPAAFVSGKLAMVLLVAVPLLFILPNFVARKSP